MIKINDKYPISISVLNMNITLRDLVLDCLNTSMENLNEVLLHNTQVAKEKAIENKTEYTDWYFNIPLNEEYSDYLIEQLIQFTEYHILRLDSRTRALYVNEEDEESLSKWDTDFVESIVAKYTNAGICNLFTFADYINNTQLLRVCAIYIATNIIKKKTPQELRKMFNINNDLTKEEEEEIDEQTKWIKQYE
jgi:hypothetical protein